VLARMQEIWLGILLLKFLKNEGEFGSDGCNFHTVCRWHMCVLVQRHFFLDEEGSIVAGDTTGVGSNGATFGR
jgi:hypothetical protein